MNCQPIQGGWICGSGPREQIKEESAGVKWCFVCRKRVEFTDRLMADKVPSYYDPTWVRKCSAGHTDGDLFPGYYREYA